ncbi:hypothetical protein B9T31_02280 [Acinetobacter sp. ANC 4558]|uniref:hypothetical protein n=1 Tax=Acinetobacter sp. ANC 4558 TaxID=1977876 RepID=UPI000A341EB7|nr:hypothetical protein [Acinetobacter sp. ANC 4558]OTG88358.1 hypothetical protein B9T31_02280 [Acinetobacter sp. ANC 4558]
MLSIVEKLLPKKKLNHEQNFLDENNIQYDKVRGYIVDGIVLNELSDRLQYLSNRKMYKFDNLKDLYFNAMIINEKIDLDIANQRFVQNLGNTEENLKEFKEIVKKLNNYYRQFLRDKP